MNTGTDNIIGLYIRFLRTETDRHTQIYLVYIINVIIIQIKRA